MSDGDRGRGMIDGEEVGRIVGIYPDDDGYRPVGWRPYRPTGDEADEALARTLLEALDVIGDLKRRVEGLESRMSAIADMRGEWR